MSIIASFLFGACAHVPALFAFQWLLVNWRDAAPEQGLCQYEALLIPACLSALILATGSCPPSLAAATSSMGLISKGV